MKIVEILNNAKKRIATIDGDKPTMSMLDGGNLIIGQIELDTCVKLLSKGYPANFDLGSRSHNELAELPEYDAENPVKLPPNPSQKELEERLDRLVEAGIGKTPIDAGTPSNVGTTKFAKLAEYSVHELEEYLETLGYSVVKTDRLEYLEELASNHPC